MRLFMWGALTLGCAAITVCFLRYWRTSRDSLFIYFAVAFAIMAVNWLGLSLIDPKSEVRHTLYFLRMAAFVLIIIGIVDKNRRGRQP